MQQDKIVNLHVQIQIYEIFQPIYGSAKQIYKFSKKQNTSRE